MEATPDMPNPGDDWTQDLIAFPSKVDKIIQNKVFLYRRQVVLFRSLVHSVAQDAMNWISAPKVYATSAAVLGKELVRALNSGVKIILQLCGAKNSSGVILIILGSLGCFGEIIDDVIHYCGLLNAFIFYGVWEAKKLLYDEVELERLVGKFLPGDYKEFLNRLLAWKYSAWKYSAWECPWDSWEIEWEEIEWEEEKAIECEEKKNIEWEEEKAIEWEEKKNIEWEEDTLQKYLLEIKKTERERKIRLQKSLEEYEEDKEGKKNIELEEKIGLEICRLEIKKIERERKIRLQKSLAGEYEENKEAKKNIELEKIRLQKWLLGMMKIEREENKEIELEEKIQLQKWLLGMKKIERERRIRLQKSLAGEYEEDKEEKNIELEEKIGLQKCLRKIKKLEQERNILQSLAGKYEEYKEEKKNIELELEKIRLQKCLQKRKKIEQETKIRLQKSLAREYEEDKIELIHSLSNNGSLGNISRHYVFHGLIPTLKTGFFPTTACIRIEDLSFKKLLGSGSFGKVWKATWRGFLVAVKEFLREDDPSFDAELEVFSRMVGTNSSHIVQLLGYCEKISIKDGETVKIRYLVLELMTTNLTGLLGRNEIQSLYERVDIMLQIATGMKHLQGNSVIYRDMKPSNILATKRKDGSFLIKLADFGISKTNFRTGEDHTEDKGTRMYMAPEMLDSSTRYSSMVDVFSFGVVCAQILTGQKTLRSVCDKTQIKQIRDELKDEFVEMDVPAALKDLILRCWEHEDHKRPTFAHIYDQLCVIKREILIRRKLIIHHFYPSNFIYASPVVHQLYDTIFSCLSLGRGQVETAQQYEDAIRSFIGHKLSLGITITEQVTSDEVMSIFNQLELDRVFEGIYIEGVEYLEVNMMEQLRQARPGLVISLFCYDNSQIQAIEKLQFSSFDRLFVPEDHLEILIRKMCVPPSKIFLISYSLNVSNNLEEHVWHQDLGGLIVYHSKEIEVTCAVDLNFLNRP